MATSLYYDKERGVLYIQDDCGEPQIINTQGGGGIGLDGKDGITPQLQIEAGYWYVSYDNGETWEQLGKATGEDGEDGKDGDDGRDGRDGRDGKDGQDGQDGEDGKDGADGKDGITPQLKIQDGHWYVSYDGGNTWSVVGAATGGKGADGKDGADGSTPVIGVALNDDPTIVDNQYYWTVDGEFLLDEDGNPIPATGPRGPAGNDGRTPEFYVDENCILYVRYDDNEDWRHVGVLNCGCDCDLNIRIDNNDLWVNDVMVGSFTCDCDHTDPDLLVAYNIDDREIAGLSVRKGYIEKESETLDEVLLWAGATREEAQNTLTDQEYIPASKTVVIAKEGINSKFGPTQLYRHSQNGRSFTNILIQGDNGANTTFSEMSGEFTLVNSNGVDVYDTNIIPSNVESHTFVYDEASKDLADSVVVLNDVITLQSPADMEPFDFMAAPLQVSMYRSEYMMELYNKDTEEVYELWDSYQTLPDDTAITSKRLSNVPTGYYSLRLHHRPSESGGEDARVIYYGGQVVFISRTDVEYTLEADNNIVSSAQRTVIVGGDGVKIQYGPASVTTWIEARTTGVNSQQVTFVPHVQISGISTEDDISHLLAGELYCDKDGFLKIVQ